MNPMPEKTRLQLGMVPLADAAPLVVARERGYFARHGLDVGLSVEGSWAGVRDKLAAGLLDAAHLLAPMPVAAGLNLDGFGVPLISALVLSRNGNLITLSRSLADRLSEPGVTLKSLLDAERAQGQPRRVLAHVFPFSSHHFQLREWLRQQAVDPDRDVELVCIPPPLMVHCLREGVIDGFCAGAPWGFAATQEGTGSNLLATRALRPGIIEKVLGVRADWALRHPETHRRLLMALIEAGQWLEQPGHRMEAAQLMTSGAYVDVPLPILQQALSPPSVATMDTGLCFSETDLGRPRDEDRAWLATEFARWPGDRAPAALEAALASFRTDLHDAAVARLCASTSR